MARVLFVILVLVMTARIAQLELRVRALTRASPCFGLAKVPALAMRDYDHRLERAVRLIDYCDRL